MMEEFLLKMRQVYPALAPIKNAKPLLVVGTPVTRIVEVAEKKQANMIIKGLTGLQAAASVLPRQVVNAHTIFNATCALVFLPLVTYFARIVYRLVPVKPLPEVEEDNDFATRVISMKSEEFRKNWGRLIQKIYLPLIKIQLQANR